MSAHDSRRASTAARRSMVCLSLVGLMAASPTLALAEGAVRVLRCAITRVCDGAGRCEGGAGNVVFRLEPKNVGTGSAGHYVLRYGGEIVEMEALSDAGPFVWSVGSERHALLASSETQWLWHALSLEPAPKAVVRFLMCSFEG